MPSPAVLYCDYNATMLINPYESPQPVPDFNTVIITGAPRFKLYSPAHVAWATFLGAPLAGCVLMAIIYRRLGDTKSLWTVLAGGSLLTLSLAVLGFFLPENFPSLIPLAATTVGMWQLTKYLQGTTVERHLANGGQLASTWAATGIALLVALVLIAIIFGILFTLPEAWLE